MKYTKEQQKQGAELMSTLVQEALNNSEFKTQLIKNPTSAIEKFTGKSFSMPGKKVKVDDQSDSSVIYLNIPCEPNLDEMELTDEQLEAISGGILPILFLTVPLAEAIGAFALGVGIYSAVK